MRMQRTSRAAETGTVRQEQELELEKGLPNKRNIRRELVSPESAAVRPRLLRKMRGSTH